MTPHCSHSPGRVWDLRSYDRVQSAAFLLAPLPPKDTQDGGLRSELFYCLHFGEGPADSELLFTLPVNRNEDIQGQDVQPLPWPVLWVFSCNPLHLPSSWTVRLLPSPRASTPLPPPSLPFLQQPDYLQVCLLTPERGVWRGAHLGEESSEPPAAGSQAPAQPIHSALPSSLPVSTARPQRFPPFSVTRCLVIHGF